MAKEHIRNQDNTNHGDNILTRNEIQKLVAEAKLDVARWIITILLALFALLGIVYPWIQSSNQEARVSKAIDEMETKFEELAGKQLRKPQIVCMDGKESLLNNVIELKERNSSYSIEIHNKGDGLAGQMDAYLYLQDPNKLLISDIINFSDWKQIPSDEQGYDNKFYVGGCSHLSPQDYFNILLYFPNIFSNKQILEFKALLKVYYEEPEPIIIPFTLKIGRN